MLTYEIVRKALLSLLFLPAAIAAAAPSATPKEFKDLRGGRWAVKVSGLLCTACARAITTELSNLPEVDSVKSDFDKELIFVKVKDDKILTVAELRKGLKRAAKRVNLGTNFEVESVFYKAL
jgi:copper chaperone CopZ